MTYNEKMASVSKYIKTLQGRAAKSRVYRKFQLDGLEIAQMLDDEKHKSLYIKLAKTNSTQRLRELARSIAENPGVKNRGAYFMACLQEPKKRK